MKWNNSSDYISFLRRLLIFSIVLGLAATGVHYLVPSRYITPTLPWMFLFFIAVTLVGYYFILRSTGKKFIRFINSYILVTVVKLCLFIGVIFFYLLNHRQDAAAFAIAFLILYLCYIIFEVVNLVSYFKPPQR